MSDMERLAICPGSFDPITKGHEDIIRRAGTLFDRVIVVVSSNPDKRPIFSLDERVGLIRDVCGDMPNMEVDKFSGLLIDYVRAHKAVAIVKGLRAVSDFDYEFQMALTNKKLYPYAETVFLTPNSDKLQHGPPDCAVWGRCRQLCAGGDPRYGDRTPARAVCGCWNNE